MNRAQGTEDPHVALCDAAQVGLISIRITLGQLTPLIIKFLCISRTQRNTTEIILPGTLSGTCINIQNRVAEVSLLLP